MASYLPNRPRESRIAWRLVALAALVYVATAPGHLQSGDFRSELAVAQSLTAGSFEVRPSLPDTYVPSVTGPGGRRYSKYGLGEPILLLPAALGGRLAGCPADPGRCPPDAQRFTEWIASFIDGLVGALAVGLLFLLALDLGAGIGAALALALLFGFATIAWDYAHDAFDVGPSACFLLAACLASRRAVREPGGAWPVLAGGAAGFGVLLRIAGLAALPLFALYLLAAAWTERRRALRLLGRFAVGAGACLLLLALYDLVRFGSPFQTGYGLGSDALGFDNPFVAGLPGLLFSPGKSVFVFSPIVLAALLGWPALFRRDRLFTLLLAALIVEALLVYGSYSIWSGDWAWGPRYLVPVTPLLVVPLLPVLESWPRLPVVVKAGLGALAAVSALVALLGVAVDFLHQMVIEVLSGTDLSRVYWVPAKTAPWIHLQALLAIIGGHAYYPPYMRAGDVATGVPPLTTVDFWWIYELDKGTNPVLVLLAVGLLAYGVLRTARGLLRDLG